MDFSAPKGRNQYFDFRNTSYNMDKDFISGLITNAINANGVCMEYYIVSYDLKYDPIWGEDNNRRYIRTFSFMSYFELPREDKMWNVLGVENIGNLRMIVSKKHFNAASNSCTGSYIPQIGDIIMSKYNKYIYEITEVAEGENNFLQSKQHTWEFVTKPYTNENIDTTAISGSTVAGLPDADLFDITNPIDVKKEDIIYKPILTEKPKNDPFSNF